MKKTATIHRMATPDHLCPWGIKALDLLHRHGYKVDDHLLTSREANAAYKREHDYDETPQIAIAGKHIGGYDALREYLDLGPDPKEGKTYQPVVAVFAVALLMALAASWGFTRQFNGIRLAELFVAFSMCVLGILKLQDLLSFATGFVQYDLVARHYVPYAYIYPFVETGAGVLMIASTGLLIAAPAALIVGTIGAVSVFKAVYLEHRDLNCACVGGGSQVPLGFISLTENLMMILMAIWMFVKTA